MSDTTVTTREPARDVVARSLGVGTHTISAATHEDMLLYLAEQIDMLYDATDKLLRAVQLLVQDAAEQGQRMKNDVSTRPTGKDGTGAP